MKLLVALLLFTVSCCAQVWPPDSGATHSAIVLVEQHTASNSAELDFTTGITTKYDEYRIEIINLVPATNDTQCELQFSTNGGATYDTGNNYGWRNFFWTGTGNAQEGAVSGAAFISLSGTSRKLSSTAANGGLNTTLTLFNPLNAAGHKFVVGPATMYSVTDSANLAENIVGEYISNTAANAFRILQASGNLASGTVRLYGVAK